MKFFQTYKQFILLMSFVYSTHAFAEFEGIQFDGSVPARFGKSSGDREMLSKLKGERVSFPTFDSVMRDYGGNRVTYTGVEQRIYKNKSTQELFLEQSYKEINNPREFYMCFTFDAKGDLLGAIDPIFGTGDFISKQDSDKIANQCLNMPGAFLVEIVHTHPAYELYYGQNLDQIRIYPLSVDDITYLKGLSGRFPNIYIRSRAIVPNGYNYVGVIKSGRFAEDPFIR